MARVNLPLSLYTEMYWQIDLHNLMHFLRLRLDAHAQYEIRVFAEALAACAKAVAPLAWEAFEEHRLHAERFARSELAVLREAVDPERLAVAIDASGFAAVSAPRIAHEAGGGRPGARRAAAGPILTHVPNSYNAA